MTSVQTFLDAAASANATTMASGDASKIFREALAHSIKVRIQLKADDRSYLTRTTSFPLVFTGEKVVTTDHPLLSAMREIARESYESLFQISKLTQRTLVVGAAAREIRMYNTNSFIHYYVYGKENKDYDRIVRPALSDIAQELRKKALKTDRSVFLHKPEDIDFKTVRPVVKRYFTMHKIFADYMSTQALPATIHLEPIESDVLLFEDSIYNFGVDELCDLFKETGANIAYGYALLPMDLIFDEMPDNRIYQFSTFFDYRVVKQDVKDLTPLKFASLTFRQGYSNGYIHEYEKWRTLLAHPAMKHNGISLGVEIVSRIGCMCVFKIFRCTFPEKIIRTFELTESESFVKLLDLYGSINHSSCKLRLPLKYFSVRESEFFDVYNYLLSLDVKSLTLQNAIMYVRRRMGGMSLVSRELVAPWDLNRTDAYRFSIAVFMQASLMNEKITKGIQLSNPTSVWEKFKRIAATVVRSVFYPVAILLEIIFAENLTDKIVVYPGHGNSITQRSTIYPSIYQHGTLHAPLHLDFPNEEKLSGCPFCDFMNEEIENDDGHRELRRGEQIFDCKYKISSEHVFSLTETQCQAVLTSLMDDDHDPVGLKTVKSQAKEKFPRNGFSHTCRVSYIRGGPGTGKSRAIRSMADACTLILAPFTKLKADYMNVMSLDGKIDLCFKTQHRAMSETGHKTIFVDEFSSFPYEYLCAIAYLNKAEEIVLVGDERQTKVQEPSEGMYIGNYIDLTQLSQHELTVNFRNPQDTVQILNNSFGYNMKANSKIVNSIKLVTMTEKFPEKALRMSYSKAAAAIFTGEEKNTVRSNQGGTYSVVVLDATTANGSLPEVDELTIVGISRHTDVLYIVSDNSETSRKLFSKLGIVQDWADLSQSYVHFPVTDIKAVNVAPVLKDVVPFRKEQPGKDAHTLAETFVPPVCFTEQGSLNELASQVQRTNNRSATTNITDLFVQVNPRGHPKNMLDKFYAVSSGYGLNFSPKLPMQELAVVAARYDGVKAFYPFNDETRKYAEKFVDEYFDSCKMRDLQTHYAEILTEEVISTMADKFFGDAMKKNYPQRFEGEKIWNGRNIAFHIKSIMKPVTNFKGMDLNKVGQGIAAWSAETVSMFCFAFRLMFYVDLATDLHDNEVYMLSDQNIPETQFLDLAKTVIAGVMKDTPYKHAVTDGVEFDSLQNEWTQYLERYYWMKLGFSPAFIDHYYSFRHHYKMYGTVVTAKPIFEKNTGEPGTLANNGIISKVLSHAIVKGDGPMVIMSKGDDFDKCQLNLVEMKENKLIIEKCCPLRLKVSITNEGDFCGYTVTPVGFMPNLYRRVLKITACRWRGYAHFCEYQKSLRDYHRVVESIGANECIASTAMAMRCSVAEATALYDFIISWGHINQQQWINSVNLYVVAPSIPRQNPHTNGTTLEV